MSLVTVLRPSSPSFVRGAEFYRPARRRGQPRPTPSTPPTTDVINQIILAPGSLTEPPSPRKLPSDNNPSSGPSRTSVDKKLFLSKEGEHLKPSKPVVPRKRKDSMPALPPRFQKPPQPSRDTPDDDDDVLEAQILIAKLVSRGKRSTRKPSDQPSQSVSHSPHNQGVHQSPPSTPYPSFYIRAAADSLRSLASTPTPPRSLSPSPTKLSATHEKQRRSHFSKSPDLYRHVLLKQHAERVARWKSSD